MLVLAFKSDFTTRRANGIFNGHPWWVARTRIRIIGVNFDQGKRNLVRVSGNYITLFVFLYIFVLYFVFNLKFERPKVILFIDKLKKSRKKKNFQKLRLWSWRWPSYIINNYSAKSCVIQLGIFTNHFSLFSFKGSKKKLTRKNTQPNYTNFCWKPSIFALSSRTKQIARKQTSFQCGAAKRRLFFQATI